MEEINRLHYQDSRFAAAGDLPATENVTAPKRQRRPSVRLGEIGDQPAAVATLFHESLRRPKPPKDPVAKSSSKTRQLAKLTAGASFHEEQTLDSKPKRAAKKPRANSLPKIDDDAKSAKCDDDDDEIAEHSKEESGLGESQLKRNLQHEEDEADLVRDVNSEDGVKNWLQGMGLVRYWPVFEIHEVDEEVLPLLTLDDLKDMGINAVGTRRKMFGAIQKLRKGFS